MIACWLITARLISFWLSEAVGLTEKRMIRKEARIKSPVITARLRTTPGLFI
jgi:hypothetical protein